ncbi:hypothetical protein ACHAQA_009725 [Verticillium albo-atrum]
MAAAHTTRETVGGNANPIDTTGLCLLSLDGGGVRGLSTLHVLKGIMDELNHERAASGLSRVKPCDVFDLIGGTSTGGLIAIMLGGLEMDVDECIAAYNKLSADVFAKPRRRIPVSSRGEIAPRFDSAKLKAAVLKIVASRGLPPDAPFDDSQDRGFKVFVCAASKDLNGIERLRAYSYPWKRFPPCTICEAALATSAATGFFDAVQIGARRYVDGALGANNPVEQVEGEASDFWCRETGDLKPLVKSFVSIGTGNPGKKSIQDRVDKFISQTLVDIATETEKTAALFNKRWRQHHDRRRFFRFNVEQGLQDVGLAEHEKRGIIETATEQYMAETAQESRVRDCVQNLKEKQSRAREGLARMVEEFATNAIIRQYGGSRATSTCPVHFIPFLKNRKFVGRASTLDALKEKLSGNDDRVSKRIALVGLGGVGKTQVALQVAYWAKENRPEWSVFWVSALNMASFEQSCRDVARLLGLDGAEKEDARELVQSYLESGASGRWLLVIDNVDDEEVVEGGKQGREQGIRDFLPRTDRGRILFTTRTQRIATRLAQSDMVVLSQMDGDEASDLLKKSLRGKPLPTDEKGVAELLDILTCLPLAIVQGAAYLNETRASVSEYIRLLRNTERDMVELLETEFADDTRYREAQNAVASTWVVTFEQIRKNKDASMLLSFIAQVESKAIPRSMLPPVGSEQRMTRAVGVLCGYSFLSTREDGTTYDMHQLVHLASRVWVTRQDDADQQRRTALIHLGEIFSTDEWEEREKWHHLLPHVLKAIEVEKEDKDWVEEESHLGYWVGRCLLAEGQIREAVKVLKRVVAVRETTLANTHPDRLASQHALASAYQEDGQTKEAIKLLERVVAVQETTLADTHPGRLELQHSLACVYLADRRVKEAITRLERIAAVRETTLAETHPNRLNSQHILASAYQADGRVKEAITLLERVVAIHEITLAETHLDRLNSQHLLAIAYQADGQVKEAIKLLERVVAIHEITLTETYPSRLASQHALACAYQADGQVKEAIKLLERVVVIQEITLAETHPDRLTSQHSLACAYEADGQMKEAITLLKRVVAVQETKLADTHTHRLASQHELASSSDTDGQVSEAVGCSNM